VATFEFSSLSPTGYAIAGDDKERARRKKAAFEWRMMIWVSERVDVQMDKPNEKI